MGREETLQKKQEIINELKEMIEKSNALFLTDFSGMTVDDFQNLRGQLNEIQAEYRVIKNTLFQRACEATSYKDLINMIVGPTAVVFSKGDPVETTKKLVKFNKDNKRPVLKGGYFQNSVLSGADIIQFSKLPSMNEMLSITVGTIAAPLTNFVSLLNNVMASAVRVINEIKNQKEQKGE